MKARYIRVSTAGQNTARQTSAAHPDEELFIDVCSGSTSFKKRPQALELLDRIKYGEIDYLTVHSIDRLGRSLLDILKTLDALEEAGVVVKVENLGLESMVRDKPNAAFKLIISVLANIAEMERETMLERQREGIAIAKANGAYKGRRYGTKESEKDFLNKYPEAVKFLKQGLSLRVVARLTDTSLGTIQKVRKILQES